MDAKIKLNKLQPFLKEIFEYQYQITLDTPIENLNMDSIKFIELIVKSEEIFGFEIKDEHLDIKKYVTLNDFIKIIDCRVENEEK